MRRLFRRAFDAGDYRQARFFLARLRAIDANHPVLRDLGGELAALAADRLAAAEEAAAAGDPRLAADRVRAAAAVDPDAAGLRRAFGRITGRYQVLKAGVLGLAADRSEGAATRFPPTDAEDRAAFLEVSRLFEIDRVDEAPHYRSPLFEGWEPTDLGRRAAFRLRPRFPDWLPQPPLDAADILAGLRDRLDPASPLHDERLAEEVAAVRQLSPREFEVTFARVPLTTEAVLADPVRVVAPGGGIDLKTPFFPRVPAGGGESGGEDPSNVAVYRRAVPEPDDARPFHVAEVRETAYADGPALMQGWRRGEFDVLVHPRPWDVPELLADETVLAYRSGLPATHAIQLNPASQPLKNAELRRALLLALDRRAILDSAALRVEAAEFAGAPAEQRPKRDRLRSLGRVVSAPFPSFSEATNPLLEPQPQDLPLAYALALAAGKAAGGEVPELTLLAPDDEVAAAAVGEIVATWQRIGLSVNVVVGDAADARAAAGGSGADGGWDLAYRTLRMREPSREIAPLLTNTADVTLESLLTLSDWLRSDLIALERVGNRNDAVAILHDLHRHLRGEGRVIPLWEIDEFVFTRRNVRGPEDGLVHPYQGVARWEVTADLPADDFDLPGSAE